MKNDGATKDYKFGNKNNWRRWNWNRIVENLYMAGVNPKNAIVIYLAGRKDHDRHIALSRGFRSENLIAIDRDNSVVGDLRKSGKISIQGTMSEILANWPTSLKVNVVLLDFCSGICREQKMVIAALITNGAFSNSITSVNLQRGRDVFSENAKSAQLRVAEIFPERIKHRGLIFLCLHVSSYKSIKWDFWHKLDDDYLESLGRSQANSYKSTSENGTVVVYDSVVYRNPTHAGCAEFANNHGGAVDFVTTKGCEEYSNMLKDKTKWKIVANIAVRTRRINAFASN